MLLQQPGGGGQSRRPSTCLAFAEAKLNFTRYINTRANFLADDLSRDNLAPHMDKYSTPTSTTRAQGPRFNEAARQRTERRFDKYCTTFDPTELLLCSDESQSIKTSVRNAQLSLGPRPILNQ